MSDVPDSVILEICEHIDGVLDAAYHRMGMEAPRHNGRPMMAMIRSEMPTDEDEALIWLEAWRAFINILFDAGPHPDRVTKRLYALVWAVNREKVADLSQTGVALLFKETRAATNARIAAVYTDFLKKRGYRGTKVPGQKSETACQTFSQKAKGNTSRRSGKKKGDTNHKKPKP